MHRLTPMASRQCSTIDFTSEKGSASHKLRAITPQMYPSAMRTSSTRGRDTTLGRVKEASRRKNATSMAVTPEVKADKAPRGDAAVVGSNSVVSMGSKLFKR